MLGGAAVVPAAAVYAKVINAKAPRLEGGARDWLNVPRGPLSWQDRAGQVTVVHFWTFGCINCRRNLPVYDRWRMAFGDQGVELIGIHSPEFPAEAMAANVIRKVRELGIAYPVLLDPDHVNWRRWDQQFWPAVYLVDKKGVVRYRWDGELNYANLNGERKMNSLIEALLAEQA
jgi:thiol-disulfide isomerase/thioredoxin